MKYNADIHHRKSTRLPHYDYSQNGMYFITICTEGRQHLFGEIIDEVMKLNTAGKIIQETWIQTLDADPDFSSYVFVIMPNHFHAIVQKENVGAYPCGRPVGEIIGAFKSKTTNLYIECVYNETLPAFKNRIWQRNFHDHVIRNDESLEKITNYIIHNPKTWETDTLHNSPTNPLL